MSISKGFSITEKHFRTSEEHYNALMRTGMLRISSIIYPGIRYVAWTTLAAVYYKSHRNVCSILFFLIKISQYRTISLHQELYIKKFVRKYFMIHVRNYKKVAMYYNKFKHQHLLIPFSQNTIVSDNGHYEYHLKTEVCPDEYVFRQSLTPDRDRKFVWNHNLISAIRDVPIFDLAPTIPYFGTLTHYLIVYGGLESGLFTIDNMNILKPYSYFVTKYHMQKLLLFSRECFTYTNIQELIEVLKEFDTADEATLRSIICKTDVHMRKPHLQSNRDISLSNTQTRSDIDITSYF